MGRWALGADLGGTNLRVAAVGDDDVVLARASVRVDRDADPGRPFAQLTCLLDDVAQRVLDGGRLRTELVGVGLGATGPVDPVRQRIDNPWTLPPSMQGDVGAALRPYGRVVVENDADVAAVAEHRHGAGRGGRSTACLTVGTGIGAGIVTDRGLHRGAGGYHPEAGHHVVDPAGPLCYCGAHGCVESLASASALARAAQAAGLGPAVTAAELRRLAESGDPRAEGIATTARRALRTAARNLVAVHAPDTIVFAGQAVVDPGRLVEETQHDLASFPFRPGDVTVAVSALDDLAGCLGAAALVLTP